MPERSDSSRRRPAQERAEKLFRDHHAAVLAYVRRRAPAESVEDAVAETFLVAWRRLGRVPADEPLPWLFGVARNVIATQRRGAGRRRALGLRLVSRLAAADGRLSESEGQPAELDERSLFQQQSPPVAAALARLSEKDREAVTLIAWEGLRPSEAAAVIGDSPGAFRVRLHRVRGRLRAALEDTHEIELRAGRPPRPRQRTNQ